MKIVADAPRAVVRAVRVLGHGREQRRHVVGGVSWGELGAEAAELGVRERERVGLRRRWWLRLVDEHAAESCAG